MICELVLNKAIVKKQCKGTHNHVHIFPFININLKMIVKFIPNVKFFITE